jgi:hypothetical protein
VPEPVSMPRILRIVGVGLAIGWHLVWFSHVFPQWWENVLRFAAAVVCLAAGTSYWRDWERQTTPISRRGRAFEGVALVGFSSMALNLYFVNNPQINIILVTLAIAVTLIGLTARNLYY